MVLLAIAFNGTGFYKQNRRLKRTQREIVWKSPHGKKKRKKKMLIETISEKHACL